MIPPDEMARPLTLARLREVLSYNPATGTFVRLVRLGHFKPGTLAGTISNGYLETAIDVARYKCHRLAWFYVNGKWPEGYLDHINRHRDDNRIANLREASWGQNVANSLRRDNTSGERGVHFHPRINRWIARVWENGKERFVGSFLQKDDAITARRRAAQETYGEFAS